MKKLTVNEQEEYLHRIVNSSTFGMSIVVSLERKNGRL